MTGSVTIGSGAGIVKFGGDDYANAVLVGVGNSVATGSNGSLTINGGTVSLLGTAGNKATSLSIGGEINTTAGTGTVTVNGGSLNVGARILMGFNDAAANGTLTIAGGTVTLGTNKGATAYGASGANAGNILMGIGTTVVNLNSGTLKVYQFQAGTGTNRTINFNGGTLVALGTPNFFLGNNGDTGNAANAASTLFTTKVKAGGAIIDTNTFNITIPTALVEDTGSTGGGLTKLNTGTLTLSGANTYTGDTTVHLGTLSLVGPYLADASDVALGNTATLDLQFAATDTVDKLFINGVQQADGTWGASGNLAADHTSPRITGSGLLDVTTGPPSEC